MDFSSLLKGEIEKKRKPLENLTTSGSKYVKRSELEKERERKYFEEQQKLEAKKKQKEERKSSSREGTPVIEKQQTPNKDEKEDSVDFKQKGK